MASPSRSKIATALLAGTGIAVAVTASLTFLPPAKAQFWNDWGGRQRQQQNNSFGGWGWGDRGGWDNRQYRGDYYREAPVDYSRAPAATPKKDTTFNIVVMGDAMADWLAYGLEDAYTEKPDVGIIRKHRTDSGLIRYDQRRDTIDWAQTVREIIAAEKPKMVIMMVGSNDRQQIREKMPTVVRPAPGTAKPGEKPQATPITPETKPPLDAELRRSEAPAAEVPAIPTTEQGRVAAYGPWEFQTEKWEAAYIKRVDATIAALKSAGVPVLWVGLPSRSVAKASTDSSYLNEIYRSRAEKAGITYVDIWDGFVDEQGRFSLQGPDYEGQTRRLRTGDGNYFTKFGARKLAHYVEREIERYIGNRPIPVALPAPLPADLQKTPGAATTTKPDGPPQRPSAGPVLPLTGAPAGSEELLGGTRPPARSTPAAAPVAARTNAPTGRADDFSWPRGSAVEEPAAVTPAAMTALTKPPQATTAAAANEAQQKTDAQLKAEQQRRAAQQAPRRDWGQQIFSPSQWFRGGGGWGRW